MLLRKTILLFVATSMTIVVAAQQKTNNDVDAVTGATQTTQSTFQKIASRLSIGGYGEAVMTRNFYSDHFNRYKYPAQYADTVSHGRFDLPHVVLNLGYDFGRGWKLGMEIEFEHGGTESAVEVDDDESGEYEAETEKGGEVALEQFWIEKEFLPSLVLRAGEIVVPIGATNAHHNPTEFFTVYRPEGEANLFPCTWHQVGVSLRGKPNKQWKYEVQFLSGLDSERFGADCFVHYGATSSYEFKIANKYAVAARIDNYSVPNLRLSASFYGGRTFRNTMRKIGTAYNGCEGGLKIGTFDFAYDNFGIIARGNFDYAHLKNSVEITKFNSSYPKHTSQDGSPSKRQPIGSDAMTYGGELGYDFFSLRNNAEDDGQRLILFGRYEYYNAMQKSNYKDSYTYTEKKRFAVGVNYMPMKEIVVKAEYSKRMFVSPFNDEPSLSLGIAYSGWFK